MALVLMLMSSVGAWAAKTVGVIYDGTYNLNRFENKDADGNVTNHGYQIYNRLLGIDASGHQMENLAVEFDFYVKNNTTAGDLTPLSSNTATHSTELYNEQTSGVRNWDVRGLLKDGEWVHIQLKLSAASGNGFSTEQTVNWFRIGFYRLTDDNDFTFSIRDAKLVDLSEDDDPSDDPGEEQQPDYLVTQIVEKAQLNSNYDSASDWYGYQWYNRLLAIDASGHKKENLALDFDVYMENLDDPGNIGAMMDQSDLVHLLELGNQTNNVGGLTWGIKGLITKAGWNHVRVLVKDARGGLDVTQTITWFRFCLAHVRSHDAFLIRLKNVKLIDITGDPEEDQSGEAEFDTSYNVGEIPYTLDWTGTFADGKDVGFSVGKSFDPINVAAHDVKQCYLLFDADLSFTGSAEVSKLGTNGQIELTSSGHNDVNEATFGIAAPEWKAGKHTYSIPLVTAGTTGGAIDWSNVNFMRIYWIHMPCYDGTMTLKVDNVRIVDYTTKTKLPTLFSDGMMFQQQKPINIWGYAAEGKQVSVELFRGETSLGTQTGTAAEDGKWQVTFDGQTASYDKYHFVVSEDGNVIQTVSDILVGEVWVAAGQSNMALSVSVTIDAEDIRAAADNEYIRFFMEPTKPTGEESPYEPTKDIAGASWGYGNNPTQVNNMSAVCYNMVKVLQQKLGVPVGFLNTAIGGSVIEAWLVREDVDAPANADLKNQLIRRGLYYDEEFWVDGATTVTGFYNAKIGPLKGYNVAGVIWYQGESNSDRPELYTKELDLLKRGWERTFGFAEGEMPFVFTQVAPWGTQLGNPQFLAPLAEAMYDAWKLNEQKNMGMLAIYDTDLQYGIKINNNADPIHPTNKTPIGQRFATATYNLVYGSGEYTCAVADEVTPRDGKVIVKFAHVGDGLKTKDGNAAVHGFAIAGSDGVYANAMARIISEDEVEVWNPAVSNPDRVTYAWATYSVASNLQNSVGIPAAPFRSNRADGQKYFNPQDWTLCDSTNVWGVDNGVTIYAKQVGSLPAWKTATTGAAISMSTDVKAEGQASMKVDYPAGGAQFGPELRYQTTKTQVLNFSTMLVDVKNPDAREKKLQLYISDELVSEVTVAAATDFRTLVFDLSSNDYEADELYFKVVDAEAGSVYVDNILFGTAAADDVTTGVVDIEHSTFNIEHSVYDLLGRRVANPNRGLYIVGTKKMVVR